MKLTLDQLKVDSYSTQICENELTEVKGGTSLICFRALAKVLAAAAAAKTLYDEWESKQGYVPIPYDECGNKIVE